MISAIMFDLDGTLVKSEDLKAQSYAMAAQRVLGLSEPDDRAIEAYKEIVGATREVASQHIMDRLGLEPALRPLMEQHAVTEPSEVLTALRTQIYDSMVADPQVLRDNQWPHMIGLLRVARETACRTALATMSQRKEALHVLRSLDIESYLDQVLTREDVQNPKPDPEIYLLAAQRLGVQPQDCLVLEDSANGVKAGVSAGMNVIAWGTPFTIAGLHASGVLEHTWVVHDPEKLVDTVQERIAEHNRTGHR